MGEWIKVDKRGDAVGDTVANSCRNNDFFNVSKYCAK